MQNMLYESDLSDVEWSFLEPLVPLPKPGGRPTSWSRRAIVDGIFYLLRSGCPWRMMPREYPPWQTLYRYFCAWQKLGVWENINTCLREQLRLALGKHSTPSAAIIDSQSSKTTEKGGFAATMPARKSTVASVISWLTPTVWYSKSKYILPTFKIEPVPGCCWSR
jgi:transposase